jgi:hypothetical protein
MSIPVFTTDHHLNHISKMVFSEHEVLKSDRERILRMASLLKASTLESIHPTEVVLTLGAKHETAKIRARIMATGDERVVLDGGFSIPIHCIYTVEFPS